MPLLLVFAVTLVVAVLVSDRAHRTVLSTAVLFLGVGAGVALVHGPVSDEAIRGLAEVSLVAVLFTDGMRVSLPQLRRAWRLPGRALLLGFPLTLGLTAVAARLLAGVAWPEALLVGAALAPTDPVFASAIVGREEVPARLRDLLNVESGLNDGLALPFVVSFTAWAGASPLHAAPLAWPLVVGVALGVAVPWAAVRLERSRAFGASEGYRPIGVLSVGLLVYAICASSGANAYLACFTAGVTLASVAPRAPAVFGRIGEAGTELLKLATLLVFGSLLSRAFLAGIAPGGWAFAVVALVAAWFGPKGFASVVYGLLVLSAGIPGGDHVFHLIAATTALSILLHASSDVPMARWFERSPDAAEAA